MILPEHSSDSIIGGGALETACVKNRIREVVRDGGSAKTGVTIRIHTYKVYCLATTHSKAEGKFLTRDTTRHIVKRFRRSWDEIDRQALCRITFSLS